MLAFSSERHVYKHGSLRAGSMAVHSVVLMFETLTLHLKKIFLHIFFLPANADLQIMDYKYVYFFCMTWQVLYRLQHPYIYPIEVGPRGALLVHRLPKPASQTMSD